MYKIVQRILFWQIFFSILILPFFNYGAHVSCIIYKIYIYIICIKIYKRFFLSISSNNFNEIFNEWLSLWLINFVYMLKSFSNNKFTVLIKSAPLTTYVTMVTLCRATFYHSAVFAAIDFISSHLNSTATKRNLN